MLASARMVVLLILAAVSPLSFGHAGEQLVPLQFAVLSWSSALQGADVDELENLLSPDFVDRDAYLAQVVGTPITRVVHKYATYRVEGKRATVSPVVLFPMREMYNPHAYSLSLVEEDSGWSITGISPSTDIPEELKIKHHQLLEVTRDIRVAVRDADTGGPIQTRVHIRDAEGTYWPPQGHRHIVAEGWREDIGGDVVVAGKTWAYVAGDFTVSLPDGSYEIELLRGPEYRPGRLEFEVRDGASEELSVSLRRWIHMATRGWYSGDTHTHFLDPHTALLEAQGEDLNVINVLGSSGGNLITSVNHFTGSPSVVSAPEHIVYIGEETRHDYLGHAVLLNIQELIFPFGWGKPNTGVWDGYDFPTMASQADRVHEQGGFVAWSHFPYPHAELPIDIALGKIDAVEAMVFGNPLSVHPTWAKPSQQEVSPERLWYALLNTGFDVPALGSTDKMWNSQVSGSVRTYVETGSEFSYQNWIDGIKEGRTFFSTGPMLSFSVDGRGLGEQLSLKSGGKLPFRLVVESLKSVERLEIIVNGQVAASKINKGGESTIVFEGEVEISSSSWVAARAWSSETLPLQFHLTGEGSPIFAHTSPVYVTVDGQERTSSEDASFLLGICERTIQWARTEGLYQSKEQREEVIELYNSACGIYRSQIATASSR